VARLIDHSILQPNSTIDDILKGCRDAAENSFAAVVVNPMHVGIVSKALRGSSVIACSVVSFPFGLSTTDVKVQETRRAIEDGAEEIDMVMNYSMLRSGKADLVKGDIESVVRTAKESSSKILVKVILENCYLTSAEKVSACELAVGAGADFVKTSTGFGAAGATIDDVLLMRKTVGPKIGVKAAGGIRTLEQTLQFVNAGANRVGTSSSVQIVKSLKP
jgi:deoxyribose-phosphate aldolase